MKERHGITLVEVLLVIAICALLLAMLLPAIQQARAALDRLLSLNQIRQVMLGMHHFAADHENSLPGWRSPSGPFRADDSVLYAILPYLEVEEPYHFEEYYQNHTLSAWVYRNVRIYLLPTDPSYQEMQLHGLVPYTKQGPSSIAVNALVHVGLPHLNAGTIADGLSHTMGLAEHYFTTCNRRAWRFYPDVFPINPGGGHRRTTFADAGCGDVVPVVNGWPKETTSSIPGVTFQAAPRYEDSDDRLLQSSHRAGLLCAMYDGSTRALSPKIRSEVFWALITPRGGEVVVFD